MDKRCADRRKALSNAIRNQTAIVLKACSECVDQDYDTEKRGQVLDAARAALGTLIEMGEEAIAEIIRCRSDQADPLSPTGQGSRKLADDTIDLLQKYLGFYRSEMKLLCLQRDGLSNE